MSGRLRWHAATALASILLAACAPAVPVPSDALSSRPAGAPTPRGTLKIAWPLEPESLNPKLITGSGIGEFMWVFNSFLTYYDFNGVSHPMLARQIPTQENGDWVVNPDGTMVTTYRLRENARWHDARALTANDFVFAYEVYMDRELPVIHREPEPLMAKVEARDDHTLVITWRELYVRANVLGYRELNPLPRHLLEEKYRTNKGSFVFGEEWTSGYVGNGPFRVERWNHGSGMIARANMDWLLGPPRLEALDIRFITSDAALLANLLSGEVDLVNSPAVRASEAVVARDQWVSRGEGYLKTWETRLSFLDFQYREVPSWQRALADARVREAVIHAINRPAMADVVTEGLSSAADAFVAPSDPLFGEIDRAIRKYPFDPARAHTLMAEAGWRPGAAGLLANAAGQTFDLDVMAGSGQSQAATIIADNWRAAGVNSSLTILPPARERDREYRASFPGAQINGRSISADNFHFVSAQLPKAETGFVELNRGSFSDLEIDRLHNLALTSLNPRERDAATVALHKRMSDLAGYVPLYYSVEVILAKHKVRGPMGNYGPQIGITWNVFEWEIIE